MKLKPTQSHRKGRSLFAVLINRFANISKNKPFNKMGYGIIRHCRLDVNQTDKRFQRRTVYFYLVGIYIYQIMPIFISRLIHNSSAADASKTEDRSINFSTSRGKNQQIKKPHDYGIKGIEVQGQLTAIFVVVCNLADLRIMEIRKLATEVKAL